MSLEVSQLLKRVYIPEFEISATTTADQQIRVVIVSHEV
jgi:hypothetical protein